MRIIHFPLATNYVNSFLCFTGSCNEAFLVDCGEFDKQIENFILENKLHLKYLLLTHTHYDHVDGVKMIKKKFDVPVYSATDKYDRQVKDGDRIPFGTNDIVVMSTPGHTSDSVSFYVDKAVFVGDAIFSGAVGGTSARSMFEEEIGHVSNKILSLPSDTAIYPGHGAPSLVGIERLYNPFFR